MIFIDTGAFLARYLVRDQYHRTARSAWERLRKQRRRCFTSNFILNETILLLARRASYAFAAERAGALLASEELTVLRSNQDDELRAVDLLQKFADQRASYVDCLSFVLMRRSGIQRAFSFDRHFQSAGFELWPASRPDD